MIEARSNTDLFVGNGTSTAAHHKGIEEAKSVLGQTAQHVFGNLAGSRGAAKTDSSEGDASASGQLPDELCSSDAAPEVQVS